MPKKKKTRKQKLQADARRQMIPSVSSSSTPVLPAQEPTQPQETNERSESTFSLPKSYTTKSPPTKKLHEEKIHTSTQTVSIATHGYQYLAHDLRKTAFLTSAIVVAELLIRFIFERG